MDECLAMTKTTRKNYDANFILTIIIIIMIAKGV